MRILVSFALLFACGPAPTSEAPKAKVDETAASTPAMAPPKDASPTGATTPSVDDIWKRVAPDLTTCYETGRRAVPEMVDGRIAFVTSVDPAGKTTCVVPSDDFGLTSDVEECMRTRIERETYKPTGTAWSTRVPVAVKGGKVGLGAAEAQTSIDTIDSRGLAEDVYDIIEGLMPDVKECVRGGGKVSGRRVVVVGAKVAKDGAVACSVASSTMPLPDEARGCLTGVFSKAHFKAPKKGLGLLSVPIEITK